MIYSKRVSNINPYYVVVVFFFHSIYYLIFSSVLQVKFQYETFLIQDLVRLVARIWEKGKKEKCVGLAMEEHIWSPWNLDERV